MAALSSILDETQSQLFIYFQASDDALYNLFKKLKRQYPQTTVKGTFDASAIETTKTTVNLLDHFPSSCFSDPKHLNYQTVYDDLHFLLKRATEEEETFKSDMKDLLGEDVVSCAKVGLANKEGNESFNACAVRRVMVKWA
jgi:hypothetical protein